MPDVPRISWSSDRTLRLETREPLALAHALRAAAIPGVLDVIQTSRAVMVKVATGAEVLEAIRGVHVTNREGEPPRLVEIPVCYDRPWAHDLAEVARLHRMTTTQLAETHSAPEYTAAFIGFAPGFAYLTGLPAQLITPRLESPRSIVYPGSVAIGGPYTGIYPASTPGGWRIIGRTPMRMFDPARAEPSLLRAGDRVRFVPISIAQFQAFGLAAALP